MRGVSGRVNRGNATCETWPKHPIDIKPKPKSGNDLADGPAPEALVDPGGGVGLDEGLDRHDRVPDQDLQSNDQRRRVEVRGECKERGAIEVGEERG